jgi:hypothetical protein
VIDNCDRCDQPIANDELYISARRRQADLSDPFVFIHVECPKDFRSMAEDSLIASGNPVAYAVMALIEKPDELPIIGLAVTGVPDDDG